MSRPSTAGIADNIHAEGRRQRLLRQMTTMSASPRYHASIPCRSPAGLSPGRGAPVRPVTASFDGRRTISSPQRLMTSTRSRRTFTPTGTPPGKDFLGMDLSNRLTLKQLYLNPPREPQYVNDARRGSIRFAVLNVPAPAGAPKRQEFARCAEARGMGGVFSRSHAGCLPYRP